MRIGLLIDTYSSLYCWQQMSHHDHEYIIYRDQLNQNSSQTTLAHHHIIMKQGLDYLIDQGVDHIICPPTIELHYYIQYPQIIPLFQQYIAHSLQHSIVGKIGFVGSVTQCESINLHWGDITPTHQATSKQLNNRYFNTKLPIWTNIDQYLIHRLSDHKPDHYVCNTLIKQLLRSLKDANIDTVIGLDWSYYACDVSRSHHCRSIKRHRSDVLKTIFDSFHIEPSDQYCVSIHHTGTLRDLQSNKTLWWMLARGKQTQIMTNKL